MMTEVLPMSFLTKAFFWGYVAMLFLAGGAGVLLTRLELTRVFHLDLGTLSSLAESTLLNQYRFLKSMEIGFGLYCVVFREEIFTLRRFNRLFLGSSSSPPAPESLRELPTAGRTGPLSLLPFSNSSPAAWSFSGPAEN